MTLVRMAVVNGTGPAGTVYDEVMQTSFCRQLSDGLTESRSFYQRGPELLGLEVLQEARAARDWLRSAHAEEPRARLMLAGFSRGGSAAIMAAEMLALEGIEVDSMFLFDAVARHHFHHGRVIPANVRFSRHARRCHNAEFVSKYEGMVRAVPGLKANPIRPLFGNTGLAWHGDGDHRPAEVFLGSHGALGGVGWKFVAEDAECEYAVARWMNEHLAARDVEIALQAFAPPDREPVHPIAFERWVMKNVYEFTFHAS